MGYQKRQFAEGQIKMHNPLHRTERVCDIPVHCWPKEDILTEINRNIVADRMPSYVCITNTESMYFARRIPAHRNYIAEARFSLCDGVGVVISALLQGKKVWRFNGPVLLAECCNYGLNKGWRHFFCGGKDGVADLLTEKLSSRFPGMIIAGTYCPPFREMTHEEELEMIKAINNSKPDILWVGLGLLKQESWISRHIDQLEVPWLIGVGAAFDYHAGTARWAPKWIRSIGMEWMYRLCFEPRMFWRNVRSLIFLIEAMLESLFGKAPLLGGRQNKN